MSDFRALREEQCVLDFNAKVPDRVLNLRMSEQPRFIIRILLSH
jgi:hypothetical protein